jgi:hypothetical protein
VGEGCSDQTIGVDSNRPLAVALVAAQAVAGEPLQVAERFIGGHFMGRDDRGRGGWIGEGVEHRHALRRGHHEVDPTATDVDPGIRRAGWIAAQYPLGDPRAVGQPTLEKLSEHLALLGCDRAAQAKRGGTVPAPTTRRLSLVEVVARRVTVRCPFHVVRRPRGATAQHRDRDHRDHPTRVPGARRFGPSTAWNRRCARGSSGVMPGRMTPRGTHERHHERPWTSQ